MHCCVTMHTVLNMSLTLIFFTLVLLMVFKLPRKKCISFESIGKNFHTVPGWNECVKDNHAVARDAFWLWNLYGKPNDGHLYHSMRSSRAHFKFPLKFAKRIEDTAKADALANDRGSKNMINFGKELAK